MDKLTYNSLSAMRGILARQQAVAHNMANASTTGFRADLVSARPVYIQQDASFSSRAMTGEGMMTFDMNAGSVAHTGRPLDIAMDGDAMLGVQGQEGGTAYTRRGDLMVGASGLLTTGDGVPILNTNGDTITVPPSQSVSIGEDGTIFTTPVGGNADEQQPLDRLLLASSKGTQMFKGHDGLLYAADGGILPPDGNARVIPASLESSNVNMTQALIDMIEAGRAWETQVKMLQTAQSLDESSAQLMHLQR